MKTAAAVLLIAASAHASSLKEMLDAADKQNVDDRISSQQREKALWDFRTAWTSLLPALTFQGSYTHNQYNAQAAFPIGFEKNSQMLIFSPPITLQPFDQLDGLGRIDVPLIDSSRWFRAMAADQAFDSAALREVAMRDLVRRQVVAAWFGYAASLAVRESAKRSTKVAEAQFELQTIRAKAGAATELEMLRANAEAQRNKQLVADTETLVATTRRSLQTLTGVDPGDEAGLPPDDMRPEAAELELEKNVDLLPQVKAADKDAAGADKLSTAQKLAALPIVSASVAERITNATAFTGKVSSYTAGVGFTWRLDVPTFMAMGSASANESVAVLAAEKARLVARDQINSDWQRLNAAIEKMPAAKVQQQAADRAAQVARDRYAAGAATQLDVIAADRDLLGSEVAQIQARTELASARLSLRISAGLPLEVQ